MRSWPLLRQAAPPAPPVPAVDAPGFPCSRAGCDADTGSAAALYCTEKCQVEDALDRLNQSPPEGVPAVPNPPADHTRRAP